MFNVQIINIAFELYSIAQYNDYAPNKTAASISFYHSTCDKQNEYNAKDNTVSLPEGVKYHKDRPRNAPNEYHVRQLLHVTMSDNESKMIQDSETVRQ